MAKILTVTLNPALDLTYQLKEMHVGEVNRAQNVQTDPAGKGIVVGHVLSDLGHQVLVSGFLGNLNSGRFEAIFKKKGFDDHFIRVEGATRLNIKIAEESGQMTDINGQGFEVNELDIKALYQRLKLLAPQVDAIVISGSLPKGFSQADFKELIEFIKQFNTRVAIDTSGSALKTAMQTNPWIIKPNTDELTESFGLPAKTLEQQIQLIEQQQLDIEHIVISMGADGVNWINRQEVFQATPPRVTVLSTVGAGDSLLAGMIHGLLTEQSKTDTLAFATAVGAHAVTQIGFGISDLSKIEQLKNATHVEQKG